MIYHDYHVRVKMCFSLAGQVRIFDDLCPTCGLNQEANFARCDDYPMIFSQTYWTHHMSIMKYTNPFEHRSVDIYNLSRKNLSSKGVGHLQIYLQLWGGRLVTSYAIYLGPEVQKDTLGLDQICTSTLDHLCLKLPSPLKSQNWMVKSVKIPGNSWNPLSFTNENHDLLILL